MSIARRSVTSVSWNVLASVVGVIVGFVRSTLLARWLAVEVFGVYRMAGSIVVLSAVAANFGMVGAFLHRAPETEDEEKASAVHLTLKLMFVAAWAAVLATCAIIFSTGESRTALLILTVIHCGILLTHTPRAILVRRVMHRRLALLQITNSLISAVVALWLAWNDLGLWALISTDVVTLILSVLFLYLWRPVWRPRLTWSRPVMRYFLRFGSRGAVAEALLRALDRVDDLWTGAFLGKTELGFYSRAYAFATYPRTILASPINMVSGGTYAELKGNRKQLSKAFFRTNAFLVRSGFFLAGLLALIAPEFIRLVLGAKWMPMLDAFRLMLLFTLLDPIKVTVANLFVAVGRPEDVVRARTVQLAVMVIGLFALGLPFGIAGVALAVDIMLVVGIVLLLWGAREHVDFSAGRLFGVPALALGLGILIGRGAIALPSVLGSDWRTGFVKLVAFTSVYSVTLLVLERQQINEMTVALSKLFSKTAG